MQMAKKQVRFIDSCYRLYEQKMYYMAYNILHDEGKAEDAVQDAFMNLMKKGTVFDDPESDDCKRYIITVIRNSAINMYNKQKRESKLIYFTDRDERAESGMEMEIDMGSSIEDKLNNLPDKYREVVRYLVLEDYSAKETAQILGITEANVRKRYERARIMLRESS